MWVNNTLRGRVEKFFVFFIFFVFVMALLYFLGYENRVSGDPEAERSASTTVGTVATTTVSKTPSEKIVKKTPAIKLWSPWKSTMTTYFYVGEPADADNAFITNTMSYWDEKWQMHYGGVDSPNCRNGYRPCEFNPKENPFYFALPYAEYDANSNPKASQKLVPWYGKDSLQLLKNRWIAVKHAGVTCYAQWEDVGPNGEDDFAYVFGKAAPINTFGEHAGLDVSPGLWKCLQMSDNDVTEWAFVDGADVPAGPWKDIVTTSGTSWGN